MAKTIFQIYEGQIPHELEMSVMDLSHNVCFIKIFHTFTELQAIITSSDLSRADNS